MKPKNRVIKTALKKTSLVLALLGASSGITHWCYAAQSEKPLEWHAFATGEVKKTILDNKALSDSDKAVALLKHLDRRITLAPLTPPDILNTTDYEKKKMRPGNDYAWFIDRMVESDWRKGPPVATPEAVAAALAALDTLPGIKNKQAVRSLLYVALNLAGGDAPEGELLRLLNHPQTPQEVVYRILGGLLGSDRPTTTEIPRLVPLTNRPAHVPARALPRLLQLADHPWNYLTSSHIGGSQGKRIYPIRELAYACLLELGVEAEKVTMSATDTDEDGAQQKSITIIQVDQASADEKLRELGQKDVTAKTK